MGASAPLSRRAAERSQRLRVRTETSGSARPSQTCRIFWSRLAPSPLSSDLEAACRGVGPNDRNDAAPYACVRYGRTEAVERALWNEIAEYAARWFPDSGIVFADIHSALAFAMAGNWDALQRIIDNPQGPATDILVPIARGFDAFARRDWAAAVEEIRPLLETHERVGGSRAQRDQLEYAVTCALFRNGQRDEALQLISSCRPANGRGRFPLAGLHQG
jgi:hypothetical protein